MEATHQYHDMELNLKFKTQCFILWIMRLRKTPKRFCTHESLAFYMFSFLRILLHLKFEIIIWITSNEWAFRFQFCNFRNQDACYNFKWKFSVIFRLRNNAISLFQSTDWILALVFLCNSMLWQSINCELRIEYTLWII